MPQIYVDVSGVPVPPARLHWWDDREVLASVLARAAEYSELDDVKDAAYFVEKPWKYEELYRAWLADPDYQS